MNNINKTIAEAKNRKYTPIYNLANEIVDIVDSELKSIDYETDPALIFELELELLAEGWTPLKIT